MKWRGDGVKKRGRCWTDKFSVSDLFRFQNSKSFQTSHTVGALGVHVGRRQKEPYNKKQQGRTRTLLNYYFRSW